MFASSHKPVSSSSDPMQISVINPDGAVCVVCLFTMLNGSWRIPLEAIFSVELHLKFSVNVNWLITFRICEYGDEEAKIKLELIRIKGFNFKSMEPWSLRFLWFWFIIKIIWYWVGGSGVSYLIIDYRKRRPDSIIKNWTDILRSYLFLKKDEGTLHEWKKKRI